MKRLSDELTVSPQLPIEAIDEIAKAGFKTVICNRPDDEDPGSHHLRKLPRRQKPQA